jgi:glycosyltransferase involved in cell wall biosynthesis
MANPSICILPQLINTGGPSSFQAKLKTGLAARGIVAHHEIYRDDTCALLITGATRDLGALIHARRQGIRIVQRLDGMNWLHKKRITGLHHYLRSERMNLQLALIRFLFADRIVYQSKFTRDWWNRIYGEIKKPTSVIYNAVDLKTFKPSDRSSISSDHVRILVVEGSFKGGHERDLLNAVNFANNLSEHIDSKVELAIAGNVPESMRKLIAKDDASIVNWLGMVPHEQIPELDRSAHLLFTAEINAACPNSVVEALACGVPVVGYATGSIPELVGEGGGAFMPYGSDYWKLNAPVSDGLVNAAAHVLEHLPQFQKSARKRAEDFFGLDQMVEEYQKILLSD